MLVSDFDYLLPDRLIAQEPASHRDQSRLLVVDRAAGTYIDCVFANLPEFLKPGDVLVLNNTRVFPARLIGRRVRYLDSDPAQVALTADRRGDEARRPGARVEIFLVREMEPLLWEALVRPGRTLPTGAVVEFGEGELIGEIVERRDGGQRLVRFRTNDDFNNVIDRIGRTPLPPYIKRSGDDRARLDVDRYQTVYASERGAIAAPTAGLHFTPALLDLIRAKGLEIVEITLHVGYGTFQPVRAETVEDHKVELETYTISDDAARILNTALAEGRRVIAVGTTTTRALESAAILESDQSTPSALGAISVNVSASIGAAESARSERTAKHAGMQTSTLIRSRSGTTDLFIYPGFQFGVLSGLITNFHLPRSSLLMLVSAFAGRDLILDAYRHAVESEYRFYSYGDAMLIL